MMSETSSAEQVLLFKIAGERRALPADDVLEIILPPATTRVPHGPQHLIGLANLRGSVLPVISLNGLLGNEQQAPSRSARVVVISGKPALGLLVDEVLGLDRASESQRIDLGDLLASNFRALARGSTRAHTESTTVEAAKPAEATQELLFLAFDVADQEYALAIDEIESIARVPDTLAVLPRTDAAMIGVAELNGALVPIVCARVLLGFPSQNSSASGRLVLTRLGSGNVALLVDGFNEIMRVGPDDLDPVPPVLTRAKGEAQIEAICRMDAGRRLISILAPQRLFDPDTVSRILAQSGVESRQMKADQAGGHDGEQFIVFRLGEESYGLPIGSIDEVVRCPSNLTRVPRAPAFVKGLMNLRGKVVPVIDQGQRFSTSSAATAAGKQRVIVVTIDGLQAAFLVDAVSEILTVPAGELSPLPELTADAAQVVDRVAIERDGQMILLVDPKALLDRAEREILQTISRDAEQVPLS